ncbi:MAG: GTPase HflX [Chloroflexota bacterium]
MPRQRGRQTEDDLAAALEEERREWLRRDADRREAERREGLAPATGARTMLAALDWPDGDAWDAEDSLEELARLVETAGGTVMGRTIQRREHPDPATYFGRGKAAELAESREEPGYDLLVVDSALTPVQQRNLEKRIDGPVLDRPGLIIEIFGQRARTSEARLQVELARLEYLLPRLAGAWSHLERQVGGIGARGGPGERQIELDRRLVRNRIAALKREIGQVRDHRARIRAGRRLGTPLVALVGYTNAGKSSLMNRLTEAGVTAEDKLFATLDPTTRRMGLPGGGYAVISDTVGFIQNLPPQLIAAFRATLEELQDAHLLLHVVDASHPNAREQQQAVQTILEELGLKEKPTLLVLNKADLLAGPVDLEEDWDTTPEEAVVVSAVTGAGIGALRARIARRLGMEVVEVEVELPLTAGRLVAIFRREGFLIREEYRTHGVRLHGHLPERWIPAFRRAGKVREIAPAASANGWR